MDYKNISPTLLAKTKGLEKCIAQCKICSGTGLVKKKVTSYFCDCLSNQFCSICQTMCQDTIFTNCNHSFCEECISIHIEHNYDCPNCKTHLSSLYKIIALKINFQNI